jgi:hypothetical protein
MSHAVRRLLPVALLALAAAPARAADPPDLLRFLPARSNAIVVINLEAILASPRAVQGGWAKRDHTEYLAGAIPLNPRIARAAVAREIHPHAAARGEAFAAVWTNHPVDAEQLVKVTGGEAATAGGEPAVVTPRGSVLVPLAKDVVGVAWTDNKQELGRWVKSAKAATASPLARYLNAAAFNNARRHILIALDAEDLFDAKEVAHAVELTKSFAGDPATADAVRAFLTQLRGVVLTIDVTADGLSAAARFDSGPLLRVNPEAFKSFVVELLDRAGAPLEDVRAAAATAEQGSATLRFRLSDPELALLMGLFLPPVPNLPASDVVAVAPKGVTPEATQRYVRAVNRILDDLRRQNRGGTDFTKMATWQDAAANRIEAVTVLNVDPVALEYGLGTAGRLRMIADSLRGVPAQVEALQGQMYAFAYRANGMFWGRGGMRFGFGPGILGPTNAVEIVQKQEAVVKKDEANRQRLWQEIDSQRAFVRKEMAARHKIETDPGKK